MVYTSGELEMIGERFDPETLVRWSGKILRAARKDLPRLQRRGVTRQILQDVAAARSEVRRLRRQSAPAAADPALTVARRSAILNAADWREELRGLVNAVFDSEPETQAEFRPGVKVSRAIPKLLAEMVRLLAAVRAHRETLADFGVDEVFLALGEKYADALARAQELLAVERSQMRPEAAELHRAQGVLYTSARFVLRMARVEFRNEPARLRPYTYDILRRREERALLPELAGLNVG